MPRKIIMVVPLLLLLLSSCSGSSVPAPTRVVGKFNDYNETIAGEIRFIADGRSLITLRTSVSKLYCEGYARRTDDGLILAGPFFTVCEGGGGVIQLSCSEGRRLTADYRRTGCFSGEATGSDNTGARFSLAYGLPQEESQQYLASAQAEVAGKPTLDQSSLSRGGSGTGFVISSDGLVVTNHHVIDRANAIEVHHGNAIYRATVVARDAANDLAILKTDVKDIGLSGGHDFAPRRGTYSARWDDREFGGRSAP